MPTPNSGENEQDFVSRCIPIVLKDGTAQDQKQAAAICYSIFRKENVHPDFQRIIGKFFSHFNVKEATEKFSRFILRNGLNISKSYNPTVQFKESFEWIQPLIIPYKQDKEAKYYLVSALTADISMNNTDYGPGDRLGREDSSMNWRPVNLDHDHSKWFPYPRTRIDYSAMNDFTLEATLRVDNYDKYFQKQLDHDPSIPEKDWINHPSIEGRPHPIAGRYHFTAMAFLRKGYELPGEPLSDVVPLVFNESVGKSLCEFKDGKMVCECITTKEVKNNLRKEEIKEAITEVLNEEAPPDDSTRCPPDMHWDPIAKQCIKGTGASGAGEQLSMPKKPLAEQNEAPFEEPQCPEGYHYDAVTKQCVYGGGQSGAGQEQVATTGDDDKATCPPGQHWDADSEKCVDDVKEECEAGWHFDVALQKCVPDEAATNERKTVSDLRMECARLRVDVIHTNDKLKEYMAQNEHLRRVNAEKNLEITKHLTANATLEGRITEKQGEVRKLEAQVARLNKEATDYMKRNHNLGRDVEDKDERITVLQESLDKVSKNRDAVLKENQNLVEENLKVSSNLTEIRNREVQWNKDRQKLEESNVKLRKFQKYMFEEIQKQGLVLVDLKKPEA